MPQPCGYDPRVSLTDWIPVIATTVPTVGVVLGGWVTLRDFRLRQEDADLEQFGKIVAAAHGRPSDGRESLGVHEQRGYVIMLGVLASRRKDLKPVATVVLKGLAVLGDEEGGTSLRSSAVEALKLIQ